MFTESYSVRLLNVAVSTIRSGKVSWGDSTCLLGRAAFLASGARKSGLDVLLEMSGFLTDVRVPCPWYLRGVGEGGVARPLLPAVWFLLAETGESVGGTVDGGGGGVGAHCVRSPRTRTVVWYTNWFREISMQLSHREGQFCGRWIPNDAGFYCCNLFMKS